MKMIVAQHEEFYGTVERVKSMARKTLYKGQHIINHILKQGDRKRVMCNCGEPAAYPMIVRDGCRVCYDCARTIPRNMGGRIKIIK